MADKYRLQVRASEALRESLEVLAASRDDAASTLAASILEDLLLDPEFEKRVKAAKDRLSSRGLDALPERLKKQMEAGTLPGVQKIFDEQDERSEGDVYKRFIRQLGTGQLDAATLALAAHLAEMDPDQIKSKLKKGNGADARITH